MKVLFAPDWHRESPYQRLLAEHLRAHGVEVDFPHGTRRVLPLYRMVSGQPCDILHIHWPEAYWRIEGTLIDQFRPLRHPIDLQLARLHQPIAYTAHNLWPHNTPPTASLHNALQATLNIADVIFVHSHGAQTELCRAFEVDASRCVIVPHGDLSADLGQPVPRAEARAALQLDRDRPLALMFGRIEPYKGVEEIIAWWTAHRPEVQLAIVGSPQTIEYGEELAQRASDCDRILLVHERQSAEQLGHWLSAADVTVFNYLRIFTSGAASLARSWGVPIVLPHRLHTLDLGEPSPYVHRFHRLEEDFAAAMQAALATPPSFAAAEGWRQAISWESIAATTAKSYLKVRSC